MEAEKAKVKNINIEEEDDEETDATTDYGAEAEEGEDTEPTNVDVTDDEEADDTASTDYTAEVEPDETEEGEAPAEDSADDEDDDTAPTNYDNEITDYDDEEDEPTDEPTEGDEEGGDSDSTDYGAEAEGGDDEESTDYDNADSDSGTDIEDGTDSASTDEAQGGPDIKKNLALYETVKEFYYGVMALMERLSSTIQVDPMASKVTRQVRQNLETLANQVYHHLLRFDKYSYIGNLYHYENYIRIFELNTQMLKKINDIRVYKQNKKVK